MRISVAAPITGMLAVTGLVLSIGLAAPAWAQPSSNICTPPTSDTTGTGNNAQCLNNTLGKSKAGNPIQFWRNNAQGQANNAWVAQVVGTVKDGEGGVLWPFTDGSGLNTRYNGANVYKFSWAANELYCASQVEFAEGIYSSQGPVTLQSCANSEFYWFVLSKAGFLVCVWSSNLLYQNTGAANSPVWVDEFSGTGNGEPVWMDTVPNLEWSIKELL